MKLTMTITRTITMTITITMTAITMMTIIIITFPLFTSAILIAQKLVGPRRTQLVGDKPSWLFTSTIEDLYSELQRKKMKIEVKLKGILISTDIACFAK